LSMILHNFKQAEKTTPKCN